MKDLSDEMEYALETELPPCDGKELSPIFKEEMAIKILYRLDFHHHQPCYDEIGLHPLGSNLRRNASQSRS